MSETREAAERLRRCGDGENPYKVYCPEKFGGKWTEEDEAAFTWNMRQDCNTLARAYLAEHDRLVARLIACHKRTCTPENCVLDGGPEHEAAFAAALGVELKEAT